MLRSVRRMSPAVAALFVCTYSLLNSPAEARRWLGMDFPCVYSGEAPGTDFAAVADLNEDGKPDLIFSNQNSLSVALGADSDANRPPFEDATLYAAPGPLTEILTADFNEDGILDVMVPSPITNEVSVYLGNGAAGVGDGTLAAAVNFAAGAVPRGGSAADFNGDGILDIVVTNATADTVSVLLGNGSAGVGNGTFGAPTAFATASGPETVAVADLNSDGIQDLLVACATASKFSVLLGNGASGVGDGTFAAPVSYTAGTNTKNILAADFNEDGKQDVAVANDTGGTVSVRLGVGDGTFGANTNYTAGQYCSDIHAADFNEDGILDLVTSNAFESTFSIFLGNGTAGVGNGTFAPQVKYVGPTEAWTVMPYDFDADGILDLGFAFRGRAVVFKGKGTAGVGNGTFEQIYALATGGKPQVVRVGDFNEDGISDLAEASRIASQVEVWIGNGTSGVWNGTFASAVAYPTGNTPYDLKVADFNADGISDLATANTGTSNVSILLGNGSSGVGNGTFGTANDFAAGGGSRGLAFADFNGDSKLDIASANAGSNNVGILIGSGSGTFAAPVTYATGTFAAGVAAADFNGNGSIDLAVADRNANTVSVLLGNGDGTFAARVPYATSGSPTLVFSGDFNEDGKQDLLVTGNGVSVLLGIGDGTFATKVDYSLSAAPYSATLADLNHDGITDVYFGGSSVTKALIGNGSLGVGDGTFTASSEYVAHRENFGSAIADLNNDGKEDFVLGSSNTEYMTIHLGKGVADELIAPRRLSFGNFELGSAPASLNALLESDSQSAINLSASLTANTGGAFSLTGTPTSPLATDTDTNVPVSFAPTTLGTYTGTLTVASDADNGNRVIQLTGRAVDTQAPTSAATGPSGTISQVASSFTVTYTAADTAGGSGVATVELFYRRNGGSFASYGTFAASPIAFDTATTGGDGVYDFYTIARDVATNAETKTPAAEASVTYTQGSAVRDWGRLND